MARQEQHQRQPDDGGHQCEGPRDAGPVSQRPQRQRGPDHSQSDQKLDPGVGAVRLAGGGAEGQREGQRIEVRHTEPGDEES
jgi:hypothetical protein